MRSVPPPTADGIARQLGIDLGEFHDVIGPVLWGPDLVCTVQVTADGQWTVGSSRKDTNDNPGARADLWPRSWPTTAPTRTGGES